jgi:hypothetical protein
MNLGLDVTREQVVRALRASSDIPDQAVEFLLSVRPSLSISNSRTDVKFCSLSYFLLFSSRDLHVGYP